MSIPAEAERRVGQTARRFFSPGARVQRPGLTGLRALAALLVLAFHLNAFPAPARLVAGLGPFALDLTPLVTIGWVGVDVFFVLSGFLITLHLAERQAAAPPAAIFPRYLLDRALRVVPAYWAQIAVLFAAAWLAAGTAPDWARYVPAHLAFLQNFSLPGHSAINGIYWSLPVEFAFYLVAPWLVAAAWRANAGMAAVAAALAVAGVVISVTWRALAAHALGGDDVPRLFWASAAQFPGALEQFAIGAAAALVFLHAGAPDASRDARWARPGDALVALGLAGLVAAMYLVDAQVAQYWKASTLFYLWHTAAGVAIAALVAGVAVRGPLGRALFEHPAMLWVGTISYSLYLWHPVVASQVASRMDAGAGGLAPFALVAVPAVLAASAASYYFVERPFLRLKRRAAPAGTLQ